MKNFIRIIGASIPIILFLVGCVSPALKSKHIDPETPNPFTMHDPSTTKPIKGIAYCLPMVEFRLTAVLTNVPDPDLLPTNVFVIGLSNSYMSMVALSRTNGNTLLVTNEVFQTFSNSVLTTKVNTNGMKKAYLVTIDPIIVPDPNFLYALKITDNKASSDSFGLTIDPTNNFLQTINATNADQTSQMIENLARTAATVFTYGAGGFPALPTQLGIKAFAPDDKIPAALKSPPPARVEILFDPTSSNSLAEAQQTLTSLFVEQNDSTKAEAERICPIRLKSTFLNKPVSATTSRYLAEHRPERADGVLYRPTLPYILEVFNARAEGGTNSIQYLIRSPNAAPVFSLPVERATFVTRTTSISFYNGFLQGVNYNNPSQLAAVLELPLKVVTDIFSSVTNVLQLRLNIATAQSNIATQQVQLVNQTAALNNATTNLLESVKRLEAYKASSATNAP